MEKMSPQPQRSPSTVPLARDAEGNHIEIPEGAIGWRIRRQTGGRPRLVLDSKKQPMMFPLDYTISDVEDVLSPGNYLLDVVDKNGEPLGVTVAASIGMPRNAESIEPEDSNSNDGAALMPTVVPTSLPNTTSDVRLVLEANVRATQMAFIHNQRTLEIGLRMAETLRDSVQVLATSQADWIKSISSARGFFRNAGQPLAPVEVKQLTVTTGSGDDDENDDAVTDDGHDDGDGGSGGGEGEGEGEGSGSSSPSKAQHWSEAWLPTINQVLMQVMPMVNVWAENQQAEARARRAGATTKEVADASAHASVDEQAAAQAEHARAEKLAAAVAAASSPGRGVDVMKLLQLLPPETSAKLMKIQMALSPDEQGDAMKILKGFPVEELRDLLTTFDLASLDECTDFLRRLIHDWRKTQAARRTRATEPRAAGNVGDGDAVANADPRAAYAASVEALRAAQAERARAAQEHAAQLASAIATASSPGPGINVFSLLGLLPPDTATKLVHINAALSPEEQADAMQVFKSYSAEGMHELLTAFDATPAEECTAFLRRVIADWRAHHAAELARTKAASRGGSGSGGMSGVAGPISAAGSSGTSGAAGPSSAAGPSAALRAGDGSSGSGDAGPPGAAGA